jgi:hypothetical protein
MFSNCLWLTEPLVVDRDSEAFLTTSHSGGECNEENPILASSPLRYPFSTNQQELPEIFKSVEGDTSGAEDVESTGRPSTGDEGESLTTFYTAVQGSKWGDATQDVDGPHVGAEDQHLNEIEKTTPKRAGKNERFNSFSEAAPACSCKPGVMTISDRVKEEIAMAIDSRARLEGIFLRSSDNSLKETSTPGRIDGDLTSMRNEGEVVASEATDAALPFVNVCKTINDPPDGATAAEIPCIVYLPSSSTVGDNNIVTDIAVDNPLVNCVSNPDESSSLGSNEACSLATDNFSKDIECEELTGLGVVSTADGPVLASIISAALEEHAASLDRSRTQPSSDGRASKFESPHAKRDDSHINDAGLCPPGETQVINGQCIETLVSEISLRPVGELRVAESANGGQPPAPIAVSDNTKPLEELVENSFLEDAGHNGGTEERVTKAEPRDTIVTSTASVNSEVEGTVVSCNDETEDFQSTAQSLWELDLFGLTLSEVKADVIVVLEELSGLFPIMRRTIDSHASTYKTCGGCSWLARLRCW